MRLGPKATNLVSFKNERKVLNVLFNFSLIIGSQILH